MSFGKTDCAFPRKWRAQNGVSLLTLALLLLMLTGALMAGLAFFRAEIPAEIASAQKNALADADRALMAFASIHHRLPCPADTPGGVENCAADKAKGYLPIGALGLDAMFLTPDLRTMRYMVYRNPEGDLAKNETVTNRVLPEDAYKPDQVKMEDSDPDFLFGDRNGLDMCETMRKAYVAVDAGASASHAHYRRGGATVNVAYGLALPGAVDVDDVSPPSAFDGVNANGDPVMERPDRGHGGDYDDFVLTRDLYTVMSAFGCQPVKYHVSGLYTTDVANGGGIADDFFTFMNLEPTDDVNELHVNYDETGVISPMLASVKSVNEAVKIVKESNTYFGKTKDSAERDTAFGFWSTANASVDMGLSLLGIIDTALSMVKDAGNISLSFMPPWFGVPAPLHGVALGLNAASVNLQILALAANITNFSLVLTNAIIAVRIANRFGSDLTETLSGFCDSLDNADIEEQMANSKGEALQNLEEEKDKAEEDMNEARSELVNVENNITTCSGYYKDIGQANNVELYSRFLDPKRQELFLALRSAENLLAEATKDLDMLKQTRDQTKLPENQSRIDDLIDQTRTDLVESGYSAAEIEEALATNRENLERQFNAEYENAVNGIPSQQQKVDNLQRAMDQQRAALVAPLPDPPPAPVRNDYSNDAAFNSALAKWAVVYPACVAANRSINTTNWKKNYPENYQAGSWILSENDNRRTVGYNTCTACSICATNPLLCLPCPTWARNNTEFNTFCESIPKNGGARSRCLNQQPNGDAWVYTVNEEEIAMNENQITAYCDSTLYYDLWKEYDLAKQRYETAKNTYQEVAEQPVSVDTASCDNLGDQSLISQWTLDEALILLKRVDQRGALQ
jgi:hypothetical protein